MRQKIKLWVTAAALAGVVVSGQVLALQASTATVSPGSWSHRQMTSMTNTSGMAGSYMVMNQSDLGRALTGVIPSTTSVPKAQAPAVGGIRQLSSGTRTTATVPTVTTHHVTLVLMATDGARPDFTLSQAVAGVKQLDRFYARQTGNTMPVTIDKTFDWAADDSQCTDFASVFDHAAARVNWKSGKDRHLVIMLPTTVQCDYAGIAGEGATKDSGENLITVGYGLWVLGHEYGHNLSLVHAGVLHCPVRSDAVYHHGGWEGGCTTEEYGDAYDFMGSPAYDFDLDAPDLYRLGTLPGVLPVAKGKSTITLTGISEMGKPKRSASFVDRFGVRYWIEYRSARGNTVFSTHPSSTDKRYPAGIRIIRSDSSEIGHNLTLQRPNYMGPAPQVFPTNSKATLADGTTISVGKLTTTTATATVNRPTK